MEPLIYYPSFEPPSEIWLKFAILYFENFKPIVPYERRHNLSDNFKRIIDQTDLVEIYSPEYDTGYRASLKTIEEIEKINKDEIGRSYLFNKVGILRNWKNHQNHLYEIYREKFSNDFYNYCINHKIGQRSPNGIIVPIELGYMYMTYLAKEIAFQESAAIITDSVRFDNFTNYARATNSTFTRKNKFAKGIINLLVPKNLSDISFEKLIEFRNKNRELISAFNTELDNTQDSISNGYSDQNFIDNFNNIYSDFSKEIMLQGLGVVSIPLAAYIFIAQPILITAEYIKEILGALGIILGGGYTLNKGLKDIETGRYCKKYMTNLKRLS